jgi:predicted nucleic acid-binding protein
MRNLVALIDANVILDYVASREPFYRDAYSVMALCASGQVKGYLAFHSVSIVWYTLRRFVPDIVQRRQWMRKLLNLLEVTGASHEAVLRAIDMEDFKDFEDCLQDRCAEAVGAEFIITNNVKDFAASSVKAITPAEFCRRMVT